MIFLNYPQLSILILQLIVVKYNNMSGNLLKNYIYPIATLSGTIIGVGLFSLPYIAARVGVWVMLAYFLVLGTLVILIHRFFGELSIETPDFKRLPGFARIYLGKKGELIAYATTIVGILGSLLAYLIVGGKFLENLFSPVFGGDNLAYTSIYFFIGAIIVFFGIKAIEKVEFWGLVLFFAALIAIFFKARPYIDFQNFIFTPDYKSLFLPYGAILFSLWGASLIPEVEEMLKSKKELLKKIIPVAILIPIFVYIFFIFLVLGITGSQTTEAALVGLKDTLGDGIIYLGLFFGVLTTFTSFIAISLTLKKVLMFDLGLSKIHAFIITTTLPLIFFLLGLKSFILVISFVGGVLLGIDGLLILLMYKKFLAKRGIIKLKKEILIYSLAFVFFVGIFYELFYFYIK